MRIFLLAAFALLKFLPAVAQDQTTADSVVVETAEDGYVEATTSYPEGVYATMDDFLAKRPSNPIGRAPIYPANFYNKPVDFAPDVCFFYYKFGQETKIKAFAISFKGSLYFQIKHILKNKEKGGRSEDHLNPNMFVQVIVEGPDYIYTESDFGNSWAMGMAANTYGGNMRGSYQRMGVMWDKPNKVFHIFKFCEDFNEFIAPLKPELAQPCSGKKTSPELGAMRAAAAALKE